MAGRGVGGMGGKLTEFVPRDPHGEINSQNLSSEPTAVLQHDTCSLPYNISKYNILNVHLSHLPALGYNNDPDSFLTPNTNVMQVFICFL